MTNNSDNSTFSDLFKETYGQKLVDLIPTTGKLTKLYSGELYHQPVILGVGSGFTFYSFSCPEGTKYFNSQEELDNFKENYNNTQKFNNKVKSIIEEE